MKKFKYKSFKQYFDTDFSMKPGDNDVVAVLPKKDFVKLCRDVFNAGRASVKCQH